MRRSFWAAIIMVVSFDGLSAAPGAQPIGSAATFDPEPWLEDLDQMRSAFTTKYPDLEWEVFQHELDLSALFEDTRTRLRGARDVAESQKALTDLTRHFGDRHVGLRWPGAFNSVSTAGSSTDCAELGYDKKMQAWPLATLMPGFIALSPAPSSIFPAGLLTIAGHKIGIIKIPMFSPRAFPEFCEAAITELQIDRSMSCDTACAERIESWGSARMTLDLQGTIDAIKAAGAETLLIDVSDNGGGSEWAEAAARMVTATRLESTPMYFMKGAHWARRLASKENELRMAARSANGKDAELLTQLADLVAARRKDAETPCDGEPLWHGKHPSCVWLGNGFYSTGLLRSGDAATLRSKSWGKLVFTPLQYPYKDGIWHGPLIIVVDGGTGSAAEQFAAELQDNHAAIIVGAPTVGAGCGHTDGGTPTTLKNSGAILEIPDCMRIRPNGLNLASGVQPDVLVGLRTDDSPHRRAELLVDKLKIAQPIARNLH